MPMPVMYQISSHTSRNRFLTEAADLLSLDYTSLPRDVESSVTLSSKASGTIHAVAIWVDYQLDEASRWSTLGGANRGGDECSTASGGVYEKQMLRFLPRPEEVAGRQKGADGVKLKISGMFDEEGGCMTFDVSVV